MSAISIVYVLGAICCNVLASVSLKSFAMTGLKSGLANPTLASLLPMIVAMAFYVGAFVFYALVLRDVPVSKAYGLITFGAQIALIVVAALWFGEKMSITAYAGVATILVGLVLLAQGSSA